MSPDSFSSASGCGVRRNFHRSCLNLEVQFLVGSGGASFCIARCRILQFAAVNFASFGLGRVSYGNVDYGVVALGRVMLPLARSGIA